MKVALISRATLFTSKGGDTLQILQTARQLARFGIAADIRLTHEQIDYEQYDLLHFFNITRPADILCHVYRSKKPFLLSPILVEYGEYDRWRRTGLAGILFRFLPQNRIEYIKTIARWIKGTDRLMSLSYLWRGHWHSARQLVQKATMLLPNSVMEQMRLTELLGPVRSYRVVPNGIDPALFTYEHNTNREPGLVLCVARIEGIKNQLNLVRALNNTNYRLVIIGTAAPNQRSYYKACKQIAASNINFIEHLTHEELVPWYRKAMIHVLPSWFETCGLSTLEAAAMGCQIVITGKGYAREYFEEHAEYCDPGSPASILQAVQRAAHRTGNHALRQKIITQYTWQQAAFETAEAYKTILSQQ